MAWNASIFLLLHAPCCVYSDEFSNDEWFNKSDDDLIRLGEAFLLRLFPELAGNRHLAHVTRRPLAIPNMTTGMYREVEAMKQRTDPASTVQLAGDYLTCTGQNSAIHYGKLAAERIIAHRTQ